mgnify:FL=1
MRLGVPNGTPLASFLCFLEKIFAKKSRKGPMNCFQVYQSLRVQTNGDIELS